MLKVNLTPLPGVFEVASSLHNDQRGKFYRAFCDQEIAQVLQDRTVRQANLSTTSTRGTIRGLHFQHPPAAEMKMVRCLRGRIFDVAVDLRRHSPTFLKYHTVELRGHDGKMLLIPEGCAHGFQTLEDDVEMLYLHTAPYVPEAEGGIKFDDPTLGIPWPLPPLNVSSRDASLSGIDENFGGINP